MDYPRILLLTQPFDTVSGGGITLTNLFKGWPKEKIALMFVSWGQANISSDICANIYQIGADEHKWTFPFNIIKKPFPSSGLINISGPGGVTSTELKQGIRRFISDNIFNPVINWLGINHCNSRIILSPRLAAWLADFRPDVLYMHFSTMEDIQFARQLIRFLNIPSAVHMMDDWPSVIGTKGPLKFYWGKIIERKFRLLLNEADLHLSISDAMSAEYKRRYSLTFMPFHNPIETEVWLKHTKRNFGIDKGEVKILYAGRIGPGISASLVDVATSIDSMENLGYIIKFHIQTTDKDNNILDNLKQFRCVVINPIVSYSQIPEIFSDADIMLLANDFNPRAAMFLKLSMPTKASEYMISGTPIIVYAPEDSAITKYFIMNECGYCITIRRNAEIMKAISYLLENEDFRRKLSRNAVKAAKVEFDAIRVRERFQNALATLARSLPDS